MSASGELELSVDGVTWADDYSGALFDGLVLVPGAEATATVWIRNGAGDEGDLHFAATRLDVDRALSDTVSLHVAISGSGRSDGATLTELRAQPDFAVVDAVEPGGVRLVEVTLRMAATASNEAQIDDLRFALEVQLSEAVAVVPGVPPGSPGGGLGPIPATGVAIGSTLLMAVVGVAVGSWLRIVGRRRTRSA